MPLTVRLPTATPPGAVRPTFGATTEYGFTGVLKAISMLLTAAVIVPTGVDGGHLWDRKGCCIEDGACLTRRCPRRSCGRDQAGKDVNGSVDSDAPTPAAAALVQFPAPPSAAMRPVPASAPSRPARCCRPSRRRCYPATHALPSALSRPFTRQGAADGEANRPAAFRAAR